MLAAGKRSDIVFRKSDRCLSPAAAKLVAKDQLTPTVA
jgi:hypothetical protein